MHLVLLKKKRHAFSRSRTQTVPIPKRNTQIIKQIIQKHAPTVYSFSARISGSVPSQKASSIFVGLKRHTKAPNNLNRKHLYANARKGVFE